MLSHAAKLPSWIISKRPIGQSHHATLTAPCLLSSDMLRSVRTFKFGPALLFFPCDVKPLENGGFSYVRSSYDEVMEATGFLSYF